MFLHIPGLGTENVPKSVPWRVGIRERCTKRTQIWSIFSWTRFGYAFRTYGLYHSVPEQESTCLFQLEVSILSLTGEHRILDFKFNS